MTVHHAELADVHTVLEAELLGDSPFRALTDAHLVRSADRVSSNDAKSLNQNYRNPANLIELKNQNNIHVKKPDVYTLLVHAQHRLHNLCDPQNFE